MSPLLTRVSNSQGIGGLSGFRRVFIGRRGVGGYAITRSLRFNSSDSAYLNFTPESAGNRKTWTWSGWVKKTEIISSGDRQLFGSDSAATNEYNGIAFLSTNKLNFRFDDASTLQIRTTAVYRDASAWMHIVCAADTTQSTASDRLKMYVNGVEITDFDSANYPSQNAESSINSTQVHEIGRRAEDGTQYFNGYLADVHFIDGQALAATDFGEFDSTGIWNPKQYSGSFGTNGFHLDFSDNSSTINLGTDTSVTVSDAVANKGMDVVTFTANGGTNRINGLRFSPDFVWIKSRSNAYNHEIFDSVRGTSAILFPNNTGTETTDSGRFASFNSDGFTLLGGSNANGSGTSVAWCWKAGGPAVTNTNGSINSQVSANQDYGFSVVTYSGSGVNADSIGHGLPAAPSFFIIKARNKVDGWRVYHSATGTGNILELNSSNAASSASNWQGVSSTTISLQSDSAINGSGYNYVAYCWSEVSGFSKFGSYTGNGSFSGPTVTLGFKPRFVLLKNVSAAGNDWKIYDSARDPVYQSGINQGVLYPNLSNAEDQNYGIKWTDTGFEVVDDGSSINGNGNTIIYAAFASEPGNNWALNNFVAGTSIYFVNNQGTGLDSYIPNGFTNTQDPNSLFTDDNNGVIVSAPSGGNWLRMKATSSTATVKWMTYDGGSGGPTITLSQNLDGSGGYITPSVSGAGSSSDPKIGTFSVSSGTSYYIRTNLTGSLNTSMVLYVTGLEGDDETQQDSLFDSPTIANADDDTGAGGEVSGNYATLNPLDKGGNVTLSNGNLYASVSSPHHIAVSTIMVSSGKYYAEFVYTSLENGTSGLVGVANPVASRTSYLGGTTGGVGYNPAGSKWVDGTNTGSLTTSAVGDVIGIALDKDNNQVSFYKNNSLIFTQTGLNSSQPYGFAMGHNNSAGNFNFGQRAFAYAAPTGFKPLTTALFDDPTIADGSTAVGIVTYSGASSNQSITGINYSPDFVWIKERNGTNYHMLFDTVRGANVRLNSNSTNADYTETTALTSFDTNGFSVGANDFQTNTSGSNYVAWTWDAGGAPTTDNIAGAGNVPTAGSVKIDGANSTSALAGSIAATRLSANTSTGFSIITYTANSTVSATIGHGLNAAPAFVILKRRNAGGTQSWMVGHTSLGWNTKLAFDTSATAPSDTAYFNNTAPTSSVITFGEVGTNNTGDQLVYCWAPVEGYSAFGSYTGNSSADGTFVYTGFKPRWIMIKNADATTDWVIVDTARETYNVVDEFLRPNSSAAEGTRSNLAVDILSNGFKQRGLDNFMNGSNTHIYAAFAEHPFKTARAR